MTEVNKWIIAREDALVAYNINDIEIDLFC